MRELQSWIQSWAWQVLNCIKALAWSLEVIMAKSHQFKTPYSIFGILRFFSTLSINHLSDLLHSLTFNILNPSIQANPPSFDRCEDLAALLYLNESSVMHSLRQRYGGNLIHTYAGPNMVIINPTSAPSMYSEKVRDFVFFHTPCIQICYFFTI